MVWVVSKSAVGSDVAGFVELGFVMLCSVKSSFSCDRLGFGQFKDQQFGAAGQGGTCYVMLCRDGLR